jgi:regulator of sigma E protease
VFDALPPPLNTIVPFVIVLGVLVFVHELGHYLAARACGVFVETFSIGFGRALTSWKDRHGTVWKIAWVPLGGYVKLHGQEQPEDATPEERAGWQPGRTFHDKHVGARAIVVAAGPIANFVLAVVLYAGLYAVNGRPLALPVVAEVVADSPAAAAGVKVGDRVTAIDAESVQRFEDIQRIIAVHPAERVMLHVERGTEGLELPIVPEARNTSGGRIGVIGIRGGAVTYQPISLLAAIPAGIDQTWTISVQTLTGVWQMISGGRGAGDIGGPLRIAQLSGEVAQLGIASLISFIAVLSVNLGLINLFPIPVLDGGHLLFFLAEVARGRPLSPRAQAVGMRAGLALLAGLFIFATWNDLAHIGLFRWVAGLIG